MLCIWVNFWSWNIIQERHLWQADLTTSEVIHLDSRWALSQPLLKSGWRDSQFEIVDSREGIARGCGDIVWEKDMMKETVQIPPPYCSPFRLLVTSQRRCHRTADGHLAELWGRVETILSNFQIGRQNSSRARVRERCLQKQIHDRDAYWSHEQEQDFLLDSRPQSDQSAGIESKRRLTDNTKHNRFRSLWSKWPMLLVRLPQGDNQQQQVQQMQVGGHHGSRDSWSKRLMPLVTRPRSRKLSERG